MTAARTTAREEVIRVLTVAAELAGPSAEQARRLALADLVAAVDAAITVLEAVGVDVRVPGADGVADRGLARTFVLDDGRTYVAGIGIIEP